MKIKIMTIASLLVAALFTISCGGNSETDPDPTPTPSTDYTTLVNKVNTNISAIQTILIANSDNDRIESFTNTDGQSGYKFNLLSKKSFSILAGASTGEPKVSIVKNTDGDWCWTLDGTILKDGASDATVIGYLPQFKVEDGKWSYSLDGKKSWTSAGSVSGTYNIIGSLSIDSDAVGVKLGDGTQLTLKFYSDTGISSIKSIKFAPEDKSTRVKVTASGEKYLASVRYEVTPEAALTQISQSTGIKYLAHATYTAHATKAAIGDETDLTVSGTSIEGAYLTVYLDCTDIDQGFLSSQMDADVVLTITDDFASFSAEKVPLYYSDDKSASNVFNPGDIVLSLAAISDVHINTSVSAPSEKFTKALNQLKSKAAEQDANGIDGVMVVGDLIDNPVTSYFNDFKTRYEQVFSPAAVPMIYTIGNHDVPNYRWSSTMVSDVAYLRNGFGDKYFQTDKDNSMRTNYECRHCVVGNYNILCISPNGTQPIVYDATAISWLDSKLKELTTAEPNKYVIVLTHPMIYNTIYGSLLGEADGEWASSLAHYWATSALTSVLEKYPQAVVFGGHLHFPLNDPRSVWQGKFTVLGCASTRYMAIECGGYENMASATTMNDKDEFSQGNLVQFDSNGNMRIFRMDFYHNEVIGDPLTMSFPSEDLAHLQKYSHSIRSMQNAAPETPTAEISSDNGNTNLTFYAKDDEFVHDYTVTVTKGNSTVYSKKILTDFYLHAKTSAMATSYTRSLGKLGAGNYTLKIVARDSWGATSVLNKDFAVYSSGALWTSDEAGSKTYAAGTGSVTEDWLSYTTGTLSWTANTTGKARSKTIKFPDGTGCTVTQVSPADFKGQYDFTSKIFAKDGGLNPASNPGTLTVTVGDPLKATTLKDADGKSHTNNVGITGIFGTTTLDASVEIDYEGMTASVGLFLDARDGSGQAVSGGYATYLPGLCTLSATAWGEPWCFAETELGNPDYVWMWFTVADDMNSFYYTNRTNASISFQTVPQYSSKTMNNIVGFGVVKSSTNVFTHTTVSDWEQGYANFYQCNPDGINKAIFQKK